MIARKCVGVAFVSALMICCASPYILAQDYRDHSPISVTVTSPTQNLCLVPNWDVNLSGTAEDLDEMWIWCPGEWVVTQDNCSITSWTCPQGQGSIIAGPKWQAPAGAAQCTITAHANDEGEPYYYNDPEGTAQTTAWSVNVARLEYQVLVEGGDSGIADPDVPICVPKGTTIRFHAYRTPAGAPNWPSDWPHWNGLGRDGQQTWDCPFNEASTSPTDLKAIVAWCGNYKEARVFVYELTVSAWPYFILTGAKDDALHKSTITASVTPYAPDLLTGNVNFSIGPETRAGKNVSAALSQASVAFTNGHAQTTLTSGDLIERIDVDAEYDGFKVTTSVWTEPPECAWSFDPEYLETTCEVTITLTYGGTEVEDHSVTFRVFEVKLTDGTYVDAEHENLDHYAKFDAPETDTTDDAGVASATLRAGEDVAQCEVIYVGIDDNDIYTWED